MLRWPQQAFGRKCARLAAFAQLQLPFVGSLWVGSCRNFSAPIPPRRTVALRSTPDRRRGSHCRVVILHGALQRKCVGAVSHSRGRCGATRGLPSRGSACWRQQDCHGPVCLKSSDRTPKYGAAPRPPARLRRQLHLERTATKLDGPVKRGAAAAAGAVSRYSLHRAAPRRGR